MHLYITYNYKLFNALSTFNGFKRLIDKGYIKIKPHTKNAENENIVGL